MKCIICNNIVEKGTVEHIFPKALGGRKKIKSVCKSCNSMMGAKIDALLINNNVFKYLLEKYNKEKKCNKIPELIKHSKIFEKSTGKEVKVFKNKKFGTFATTESVYKKILQNQPFYIKNTKCEVLLEYDLNNYVSLCYKIAHEFLYDLYKSQYQDTNLCNMLSNYLYERIKGIATNVKLEDITQLSLNDIHCSKQRLTFCVTWHKNKILIGINIFDFILFTLTIENCNCEYDFMTNFQYDEQF